MEWKELMVLIKVSHLVKKYGDHYAVNDLSFQLDAGKIYGLLGPNGAGKSTTMNMITGYIASTSGEILIGGYNMMEEPEKAKKCIGYLPEIPPLYTEMTIREYLQTVAELKRIPKRECRSEVLRVMDAVLITELQNRLIKNLSKGYRQRVGIAQALIGSPQIVILDEPTVGLDPKQIIEIRDLVKSLGRKHTVILSSHILSEISAVCDEILIINKGRLIACDTTENLEKAFLGTNSLSLTAEGDVDVIRKLLGAIPEIGFVQMEKETGSERVYRIRLQVAEGADIRRTLFFEFAKAEVPILEMSSIQMSLEDVFLKLTEKQEEVDAK